MSDWKKVENDLMKISKFLKLNLELSPFTQNDPIQCKDCLFRMTSMLIAQNKTRINKLNYERNVIWRTGFASDQESKRVERQNKKHGAEWHHNMMNLIKNYFLSNNKEVISEPNLHYGKADLYIKEINTYIEVGSINLYKLYINLFHLNNCRIIIVPSEYYSLEFLL
jgi:hypothetical protein